MTPPWHGVELRHLAALRAVGAERSFRGAAERLGYVQSAVSQQISQFEGLVGERLIERERGHPAVALTAAGEVLLTHAEEVLSQLAAARSDLAALADGRDGPRAGQAPGGGALMFGSPITIGARSRGCDDRFAMIAGFWGATWDRRDPAGGDG